MIRKTLKWTLVAGLTAMALLVFVNAWVVLGSRSHLIEEMDSLKAAPVALVLGTSKSTSRGKENLFFKDRMEAAAALYKAGKVKHILVSGDNRTPYYNEPRDMQKALMDLGVPQTAITLDFAGLRTLDSVVRCKEIFDQSEVIIVTQRFHAYRALFIARQYDMTVQAYPADFESAPFFNLHLRETVARALAVADVFITGTGPTHLGEKEKLIIE